MLCFCDCSPQSGPLPVISRGPTPPLIGVMTLGICKAVLWAMQTAAWQPRKYPDQPVLDDPPCDFNVGKFLSCDSEILVESMTVNEHLISKHLYTFLWVFWTYCEGAQAV